MNNRTLYSNTGASYKDNITVITLVHAQRMHDADSPTIMHYMALRCRMYVV